MERVLAIIGGSGIYAMPGLGSLIEHAPVTPYGPPSSPILSGELDGQRVLFLARHGQGHAIPPHAINYRANIAALKQLGASYVVSLSAVGSLRQAIEPGHVVAIDQYIDLTKRRISTFFDEIAAHVAFADPACPVLFEAAADACRRAGATLHAGGTYVCIEGPQFSTRAESQLYRSWGASVIGMTALPEAKLAREAELGYVTLALVTDYDCWHQGAESVTVSGVLEVLRRNTDLAARIVEQLARGLPSAESPAARALDGAIITRPEAMTPEARQKLAWLFGSRNENKA